ncbi:hypothetical protein JHK87_044751 [Glycine soja]|nr:hypothetical protein JHK87_044751 [Glycine soja]
MVDKAVGGRGLVIWSVFVVVDHWYMVTNSLMFIRSRQHFESTLHSQIKDFASETPQNVLGAAFVGLKWVIKEPSLLGLSKFQRLLVHASDSNLNDGLEVHPKQSPSVPVTTFNGVKPFHASRYIMILNRISE